MAEVLPGEPQVGLDLEIERGQPSLDIVSRRGGDLTEDIYDDQGGALTNVVSMGLRMIAAVRSGTRRFLIMDEGDCWIATSRVPTFYRVLKEAATKVGVQCLAISHHDVSTFGDGISVARLSGDKDTGATVENAPRRHKWADDEDGIRWIRLKNFQTFIDETIHLSPGVNALEGRNNLGKSAIVRAFRAVFYGESRDALIRHGERLCEIEIGFSGGRVLHWDRQARRNPINVWKLLGPDGSVVNENGMVYETGGRTPPDWVSSLFGIKQVEGLDVHINTQKNPVFLLNKPGSTRAAVLSIGQESSHIRAMIALHKERCVEDAACVKNGETEMSKIIDDLEKLKSLDAINERFEIARNLLAQIESDRDKIEKMNAVATKMAAAQDTIDRLRARAKFFDRLPERGHLEKIIKREEKIAKLEAVCNVITKTAARINICERKAAQLALLPDALPTIVSSDAKIMAGRAIRDAMKRMEVFKKKAHLFASLPPEFPTFASSAEIEKVVARIEKAESDYSRLVDAGRKIDEATKTVHAEMTKLLADMDHSCPVCGSHIDNPDALLVGHPHGLADREESHG